MSSTRNGGNGRIDAIDDEPGGAVVDELAHGPAVVGHDGCATCHRFNDAEAEGFVEADEVQEGGRASENTDASRRIDRAHV